MTLVEVMWLYASTSSAELATAEQLVLHSHINLHKPGFHYIGMVLQEKCMHAILSTYILGGLQCHD